MNEQTFAEVEPLTVDGGFYARIVWPKYEGGFRPWVEMRQANLTLEQALALRDWLNRALSQERADDE